MPDPSLSARVFCATIVAMLSSGAPVPAGTPAFSPVPVEPHVYDGGWEHFVGGGLAVFDCNGDDLPELLAAGGSNPASLLVNRSTGTGGVSFAPAPFPEFTATTGAFPLDLDGDGLLDLALLRAGPDVLLKGDGACGFSVLTLPGLVLEDRWSTAFSATWEAAGDQPTLAFGHYVNRADPNGPFEACESNTLWRPGAQGYTRTELVPGYCALSMLFTDWSHAGRADLRISNDRHYYVHAGEEQLWAMEPTPRLYTAAEGWASHRLWGMGIAVRDLDRDGRDEVFLSSMGDQRLMEMVGEGPGYTDVPYGRGTTAQRPYTGDDGRPSTGWHIAFGDVQNDGLDDVFIAKGNVQQMPDSAMQDPNNLLIQGTDGRFTEHGLAAGIASPHRGRGAALADFDADGRLDLAVVNRRAPLEIWRNETEQTGAWVAVEPRMAGGNVFAIGAFLEITPIGGQSGIAGRAQLREVTVGGGHAGGVAGPQHFGLGQAKAARLRVRWPDGSWSAAVELAVGQRWRALRNGDQLIVAPF